jgi:meromycolic acid enoyl-[acyl-carrier-protein] reductase
MPGTSPSDDGRTGGGGLLAGRRILVTGVVTRESIAFASAAAAQRAGAEIVLTGFGRARSLTERAARRLPEPADVLELDVTAPADYAALADALGRRWDGGFDGILHAVAAARADALGGNLLHTPAESALGAVHTSAVSLSALVAALLPQLRRGASVVALDFDDPVAWPMYDWMGVSKAALRAIARYLTRDVGPRGVRVNLVSAGPLRTVAGRAVPHFPALAEAWEELAPAGWDADDPTAVADAVCFLLSGLSRGIAGEIVHVDGGLHAMGAALPPHTAVARDQTP